MRKRPGCSRDTSIRTNVFTFDWDTWDYADSRERQSRRNARGRQPEELGRYTAPWCASTGRQCTICQFSRRTDVHSSPTRGRAEGGARVWRCSRLCEVRSHSPSAVMQAAAVPCRGAGGRLRSPRAGVANRGQVGPGTWAASVGSGIADWTGTSRAGP